ncbi:long-chain fatty acid--CoA ligase [Baekduia soli]|uniref:Long-chain fatty acid--CoA ligase n=1 Tax=Baekduia soli TaxID=496014 RepID=A0A5B8U5D3_9ACTN|nr:AMP-binding protein [Baekduia soli]QEC48151.1 long-chain fatty acid--CoA ligase [Baekduia soli]
MTIAPLPRGDAPFDLGGVRRDATGVLRYTGLHDSLVDLLADTVDRVPAAEAVAELGGRRLSYRELWDGAARVAGGLRAGGVRPGDRVALQLPNGADWVLAFFGILMAGAIVVPVNVRLTTGEIARILDDAGATLALDDPGAPLPDGEPHRHEGARPEDLAAIFYTSGTTGAPKGAMHTHHGVLSNVETARRVMGLAGDEPLRTLVVVPLFHVTGCHSQLLVALRAGGTAVIDVAFNGPRMLAALRDEAITMLIAVPAIYHYVLAHPDFDPADAARVRHVFYGGAPIAPALVARIKQGFPQARVANAFGLTETTSIATYLPHEWADEHADSVGFAVPHTEFAVGDPDPATGVGELLIRGGGVCAGYWDNPEATAQAITGGWLHTGDLGRVDEHGLVYVMDRLKDMINRGGENVYSVEVESGLVGAPGVGEVAVLGVPDDMMGEKVGAVLVPLDGATIDVDAVLEHARAQLADFKVPQYVAIRDEPLPRNPGGKVLKAVLREQTDWGAPLR